MSALQRKIFCFATVSIICASAVCSADQGVAPLPVDASECKHDHSAPGKEEEKSDGKIGVFRQQDGFDCFFLASLIALANDPDGISLVESAIRAHPESGIWEVAFPNQPHLLFEVAQQELCDYRLCDGTRKRNALLVVGDPDVQILEIAADKAWIKQKIKAEGLWDDVSMNALFMFTDAGQQVIWNRNRASARTAEDIDKYKRLPKETVQEQQVSTLQQAEEALSNIVNSDHDGISIVMADYTRYHSVAIIKIDFEHKIYAYIDPRVEATVLVGDLNALLTGMTNGIYVINYLEIGPVVDKF